jgi:hypothetical protein
VFIVFSNKYFDLITSEVQEGEKGKLQTTIFRNEEKSQPLNKKRIQIIFFMLFLLIKSFFLKNINTRERFQILSSDVCLSWK